MLPRRLRLHRDKDIIRVIRYGDFFGSRLLTLKILKNDLDCPRFGFLVSKKFSNKANRRNLIKRRLRSIIAGHVEKLSPGFDILFSVKPQALNASFEELEKEVRSLFIKSRLFSKIS